MNYKIAGFGVIAVAMGIAGVAATKLESPAPETPTAAQAPMAPPASPSSQGIAGAAATAADKFTHFRVGNKNVKALFADGPVMWVATSGGLIRYDTRSDGFKLYDNTSGLLSNGCFSVSRIQGKITVGTYGGGMSVLDEQTERWTHYNVPEGLGDAFVYDVLEAANGDIWIATWSGVNRVRGGRLHDRSAWELHTVASTQGGLPNDWVYGLAEAKDGVMWLATEGGVSRFAGGRWEAWNHARGIGADYEVVRDAIAYKSDPGKASSHHAQQKKEMGLEGVDQAYNPNYIVSLEIDGDGSVWAGTWGGGLAHYVDGQWRNLTTRDGLPGNHVFMLHRDGQGRLWIGTNNGLARKEGDGFHLLRTEDGLFGNAVFSMATSGEGDLWVGSYGGVARIRPGG